MWSVQPLSIIHLVVEIWEIKEWGPERLAKLSGGEESVATWSVLSRRDSKLVYWLEVNPKGVPSGAQFEWSYHGV